MKVGEVDNIFDFCRTINHREDIRKYVESPLVPICEHLYDLNILTTMSSINTKRSKNKAYIVLDYDLLDTYNKSIIDELMNRNPSYFRKGTMSVHGEHEEIEISIPITEEMDTQEIVMFFDTIFKNFRIQEINSFTDGDTNMKNIYSWKEFIMLYLDIYRNPKVKEKVKVENEDEIDELLLSLGIKKVPSSEWGNGDLARFCNFVYFCDFMLWLPDNWLYETINRRKQELFNGKNANFSNLNMQELINGINRIAKRKTGEEYFFNPEDSRFYLNEELLEKHFAYLREMEKEDVER